MKKNVGKLMAMAMFAQSIDLPVVEQPTPLLPKQRKYYKFNEEPNVVRLIEEYKTIKKGISKKGKRKQTMIINKINKWIKEGMLLPTDII
jgi:hypothetical protein